MMKRPVIVILCTIIFTGLCAAQSQFRNFHQEGPASHDITTDQLTASHPSLPLGTQIRVTNPRNGKQVNVRITGRIPATEGRIVDLSTAAAAALELSERGRSPVVLELVSERRPQTPEPVPEPVPEPPPPEPEPEPEPPPPEPEPEPEPPPPEPEPEPEPPPPEPEPEPEPPPPEPPPPSPEPEPKPATEEAPLLPPHEDPSREPVPEEPVPQEPPPETEYVPGPDPQAPSVSTDDSKTQTTAPVAAQSPNITIYNVMGSPGSFATDSAPVSVTGAGQTPITTTTPPSGVGTEAVQQTSSPAGIIAAAPSSRVSTSERHNTTLPSPQPTPEATPAVATATAQVIAQEPAQVQQNQSPQQTRTAQPVQPTQQVQPQQTQPQIVQPVQPAQPRQTQPQAVQPVQPVQPRQAEPAPLPPIVDRGTALIRPYLPNEDAIRNGKTYRVQVGSYQNTWHATEASDRLTTVGFHPVYERYGDYIRVVIPGVPAQDIPAVARLLGRVGFTEALIREEN